MFTKAKQEFDFNHLCMLAHLGLWDHVSFYGAEHYDNLNVLTKRSNGMLLCSYNKEHDRGYNSLMFMIMKLKK